MRIEQKIKREELSLSNLLTRRNLGGVKEGSENDIETIAILYNTRCQWLCHTKLIYLIQTIKQLTQTDSQSVPLQLSSPSYH